MWYMQRLENHYVNVVKDQDYIHHHQRLSASQNTSRYSSFLYSFSKASLNLLLEETTTTIRCRGEGRCRYAKMFYKLMKLKDYKKLVNAKKIYCMMETRRAQRDDVSGVRHWSYSLLCMVRAVSGSLTKIVTFLLLLSKATTWLYSSLLAAALECFRSTIF